MNHTLATIVAFLLVLLLPGCEPASGKVVPVKEQGLSAREALAYAWPEAQQWNADARLALLRSGQIDDDGRCGEWRVTFYKVTDPREPLPPAQITIVISGGKVAGTRKENPYSFRPDPTKTGVAWCVDSTEAATLARARGVVLTGGHNKCIASLYAPFSACGNMVRRLPYPEAGCGSGLTSGPGPIGAKTTR